MHKGRGRYTVFEGLDGIGKGVVIDAVEAELAKQGKNIIKFTNWCDFPEREKDSQELPHYEDNVFIVTEPTYFGIGEAIRREIIRKKDEGEFGYSVSTQSQAYSIDREILLKRIILPVLNLGATTLSSRNFVSSLCYQVHGAIKDGKRLADIEAIRDGVLALEGNRFAMQHAPNLIVISTIRDVFDLKKRLESRLKQDNCIFETVDFQAALKPLYEDPWLKNLLEKAGSRVAYLDAGISIEESRRQAIEIYSDFYERDGLIQERYQKP